MTISEDGSDKVAMPPSPSLRLAGRGRTRVVGKRGQSPFHLRKDEENGDCPTFPSPSGQGLQQPTRIRHGLV